MKKIFLSLIGILVLSSATIAQNYRGDDLIGTWLTADKSGFVRIYKKKCFFCKSHTN